MRQLDLFGSFIDTSPPKDETEEKPLVSIKKEEITVSISREEIPYSLVELAEEMLGATTFNNTSEFIETAAEKSFTAATQSSQKSAFSTSEINSEIPEAITSAKAAKGKETKKSNKPKLNPLEENEETYLDEKKSADKIKNKQAVISANSEVSLKKQPQKRGRKSLEEIEAEVDLIEIPDDEELFQKQYYPISEVAKWFRVNNSLLRFWENEFDILKPRKNRKGDRLFRPEDVKNLQLIYQLLRQRKYTIEGAKEYIKTNKRKADTELQLTNTLQKFRSFLLDLKANL